MSSSLRCAGSSSKTLWPSKLRGKEIPSSFWNSEKLGSPSPKAGPAGVATESDLDGLFPCKLPRTCAAGAAARPAPTPGLRKMQNAPNKPGFELLRRARDQRPASARPSDRQFDAQASEQKERTKRLKTMKTKAGVHPVHSRGDPRQLEVNTPQPLARGKLRCCPCRDGWEWFQTESQARKLTVHVSPSTLASHGE